MQQLNKNIFNDFNDPQIIWQIYGELLDFYSQQNFSAKQVAYELGQDTKLINKILHRLIHHKAVTCTGTDHWGVKTYCLNEAFTT
jgi:transcription initiation factor IIE alpha subunit